MKKTDRYVYPATFTYVDDCQITISFPDLPGCAANGADDMNALDKAREVLGGHMWDLEKGGTEIPIPTRLPDMTMGQDEYATLIEVYMPAVRLAQTNKSVTRTVTVPAWLNAAAIGKGVNFSQVLQSSLMNELGVGRK